jgi:hypothetical protein
MTWFKTDSRAKILDMVIRYRCEALRARAGESDKIDRDIVSRLGE